MTADCQIFIPFFQIAARVLLMFMVSLGAILSIYWGWRLYRDVVVVSQVSGELEVKGLTLKFVSAGPGIVLAGFGAWLLSLVATHPMNFKLEQKVDEVPAVWYRPAQESAQPGLIRVGMTLSAKKDAVSNAVPAALAPAPVRDCRCQPLRRSSSTVIVLGNMGGSLKDPSSLDILHSLESAIDVVSKAQSPGVEMDKEVLRTLRSLEYLKELAQDALAQDAAEPTRPNTAPREK